jgi:maltose/moltooligosaccharide transporter
MGAFAYITAILITVFSTREYPPKEPDPSGNPKREEIGFEQGCREIFSALKEMPRTMIQLAFVQFFSWFALFSMWIYSTPAVTRHVFGATDPGSPLYNEGANWVGILFAAYNGFAAVVAFFLPFLARSIGRKWVHALCLVAGGLGLGSFFIIQNPYLLLFSMMGVGLAWASILSMPYAILAGALPEHRMGLYMGVFNFFIVIPQITAAGILGFFIRIFSGGDPIYALCLGGVSMVLAALLTGWVEDVDDPTRNPRENLPVE